MAKYVQPIFDVFGVAGFKNQTTFDASVFFDSNFTLDGKTITGIDISTDVNSTSNERLATSGMVANRVDSVRMYNNTGLTSEPSYIDNGNGSITIGDVSARLYDNNNYLGLVEQYQVTGTTLALGDNQVSFVTVDYNSGTPIYSIETDVNNVNTSDVIPVFTIYRQGTVLDRLSWDSVANGFNDKFLQRLAHTDRFVRESGLTLSETTGRDIVISSGAAWYGLTNVSLSPVRSTIDPTEIWTKTSGVWSATSVTQYNNNQYQGTTDLESLTGGHYGVNWIYRNLDDTTGRIRFVLGTESYPLISSAESAQIPGDLPDIIRSNSILVGKIIVQNGASVATSIQSAFDTAFVGTPITNHDDLSNISGGLAGEYYHLDQADYETVGTLDSSLTELRDYNSIQDASIIALATASVDSWNGLTTSVDNSIGLGGDLNQDTVIHANNNSFAIDSSNYILLENINDDSNEYLWINNNTAGLFSNQNLSVSNLLAGEIYTSTDIANEVTSELRAFNFEGQNQEFKITAKVADNSINAGLELFARYSTSEISSISFKREGINIYTQTGGGLFYSDDYSDTNTHGDRWIPDVAFVKDYVDSSIAGNFVKTTGDLMTGGLQVGTVPQNADVSIYGDLYVHNGLTVSGDVIIDGSLFVRSVEAIDVSSAFVVLNTGQEGVPPASMQSGIVVDRGSEDPYVFLYDESLQTFRIGIAPPQSGPSFDDALTQAVATREDTPESWGIGYWNNSEFIIETSAGFSFQPGVGLSLPIVTNQPAESTALVINDAGLVGSRELGSMAFENASIYARQSYVDGSLGTIQDRLDIIEPAITDLSTNKLDEVSSVSGVVGGHEVYSGEANNVAYIKKIVAGTGASIVSDASTVTISVAGAAGYVSKYTGTFDGTAGTSEVISVATHGLGTGPFNISVYDGNELVHVAVDVTDLGQVTFNWMAGSLGSSCKYIISG